MEYRLPAHVAAAFVSAGGTGPVLDVGAGTGLLAEALRAQGFEFHPWGAPRQGAARFVVSWDQSQSDVDALCRALAAWN
jgi:hypothetical protein